MASTLHITRQIAVATADDIAATVACIGAGTATLTTQAIDTLLAVLDDAGRHNSREYRLLVDEWWVAATREQQAEQEQRRWCIDIALSRILPAIAAGESTADSVELGELLTIMQRASMTGGQEYRIIYGEWLRRFPAEATCQLVAGWLDRFEREEGAFCGFTAYDLRRRYGGGLPLGITQIEEELTRLARLGRLVRGELDDNIGMYAVASWIAGEGQDGTPI